VLKVEVDRKFELDACNDAHAYMAESAHKGKIIFTM
jgi:NADPH:quinone reductase-like Zn-dependent oxidoreductase